MAYRQCGNFHLDVPDGWAERCTVVLTPRGQERRPSINLVVKRRPSPDIGAERTVAGYLAFMKSTFGELEGVEVKTLRVGRHVARAARFTASAEGKRFTQTTILFVHRGEEISATVTQLEGDDTPAAAVERLLQSIVPSGNDPVLQ